MLDTPIDITRTPFSRYGAYVTVTREEGARELIIHSARRRFEEGPIFSLTFGEKEPQDFTCSATPEAITVKNEHGTAVIYIRDDSTFVIDSRGLDVQLKQRLYCYGTPIGERRFRIISATLNLFSDIAVPYGILSADGPYYECESGEKRNAKAHLCLRCEEGRLLAAVSLNVKEPHQVALPICPEAELSAIRAEWKAFLAKMPPEASPNSETASFARLTWFNLWSSFVRAADCYKNDTMLMSKKSMSATWSWDHCFNALAMANFQDKDAAKAYAMNQFCAPFYLQQPLGVLPDMWSPELEIRWGVTKPPIHGWCFSLLLERFDFDREELEQVYTYLSKWTGWWLEYCDGDGDGIPAYPQGWDSGWDNSTVFDLGFFVESPDLPAFLILQMRTLAQISKRLRNTENEQHWMRQAEALMERFLAHSWTGERFVAKLSHTHEYEENPTSLLSLMPLVLGDLLPREISDKLVSVLKRDFLTENGLATEMPSSPKYLSDGYWRGPIWAPTTYLLVDGLRRGGYTDLARTVAERYCNMSSKKAKGNYENFDALKGNGWRAPGYTWAASVYLLLHWEYGC